MVDPTCGSRECPSTFSPLDSFGIPIGTIGGETIGDAGMGMAGDLDMDDQDSAVPDLEALDLADQSLEDPDSGTVVVPDLDLD